MFYSSCYKKITTESEYSKGASSHTSVEAGLQKKNSLKKNLESTFSFFTCHEFRCSTFN